MFGAATQPWRDAISACCSSYSRAQLSNPSALKITRSEAIFVGKCLVSPAPSPSITADYKTDRGESIVVIICSQSLCPCCCCWLPMGSSAKKDSPSPLPSTFRVSLSGQDNNSLSVSLTSRREVELVHSQVSQAKH